LSAANPGFVSVVTMAEAVWVLERAYGLTDQQIAAAIERLLQVEVLVVENEQQVFAAMVALKQGSGAFADALIAELGAQAWLHSYFDIRQEGAPACEFQASVIW